MNNKKIIWLASYPKSGNTWFRAFLTNLFMGDNQTFDLNDLQGGPISSDRSLFDDLTNLDSSELSFEEVDNLRPAVYCEFASSLKEVRFIKSHDAYTYLSNGQPLIPTEPTFGCVYIIRNPFDLSISFSNHLSKDIESTVNFMNNQQFSFASKPNKHHLQLRQKLLNWSEHVKSWTEQDNIPIIVLRYEDMKDNPLKEFKKAIDFSGYNFSDEKIMHSIEQSKFENLKKLEERKGFKEQSKKGNIFFREGKKNNWQGKLTNELVDSLIENHREILVKYKYLDENNKIIT